MSDGDGVRRRNGRDRPGEESRGPDFLGRIREVARLWLVQHPQTRDAEIAERCAHVGGEPVDYLEISCRRGPWLERRRIGAHDGTVTAEVLERFRAIVCEESRPEFVHRDPGLDPGGVQGR